MEQISNVLFWISNGLLVPVIVGLLYFFARSIIMLGGFLSIYVQRQKQEKILGDWMETVNVQNLSTHYDQLREQPRTPFMKTIDKIFENGYNPAFVDKAISTFEINALRDVAKAQTLIKFGPILGLMGTLIPMGPALAGLSTGDISSMAYNMQVAFATTVLGLFAGAVGFILLQARQRWLNTDLMRLDFIAELARQREEKLGVKHEVIKTNGENIISPASLLASKI